MNGTALPTHEKNGSITIVLNRIYNDSDSSGDSVGLELNEVYEVNEVNENENENEVNENENENEVNENEECPRRCLGFMKRFSYKRLFNNGD